ncbi:sodium:calcium antiporter [Candidatus Dependentiae bacterium]|nr:sodium:calcium antiporter [Candidatus Dependentiae bacterium]
MDLVIISCALGVVFGLLGLWWSSDKSVEHALDLSSILGITTFFVGFVFMAMATGFPELAVAIASLWKGVPGVAVGAIVGSNLIDVSLVLGLPAVMLGTLNVKTEEKLPLMLMLVIAALVMALVFVIGVLSPWHGVILLLLYVASIWWLWRSRAVKVVPEEVAIEALSAEEVLTRKRFWKTRMKVIGKLLFSLSLVVAFSKLSVDCAVVIAHHFALSIQTIGVTVFAVGTSLPELALSFQAVRRKEYSLAFGNSFGSVLEQATLILGFLAIGAARPLDLRMLRPVAPLMFLSYAIVVHSLMKKTKVGCQEGLGRKEGLALLLLFVVHVLYFLFF